MLKIFGPELSIIGIGEWVIFTKIVIFVKKYLIIEQLNNFLTREDDLNRDKNLATLLGVTPWGSPLFL